MSYRIVIAIALIVTLQAATLVACGSGGAPLDSGCPLCQVPDANAD